MTDMPAEDSRSEGKTALPDLLFAILLTVFMLLSLYSSRQESVTIDEFRHLSTGVHYWQSGDYSFDSATPPLWKMAMSLPAYLAGAKPVQFRQLPEIASGWEPWFVATDFMRDNATAYNGYLQSARLVNIFAASVCLFILYVHCRKRFGSGAALFGTSFLALSPTFLAHSHYATTDIISTLTLMGVVLLLIDYLHKPGLGRLICATLVFSISLLSKFTALIIAPLLLFAPLLIALGQGSDAAGIRRKLPASLSQLLKELFLVVATLLLMVNIFYVFRGTGTSLGNMRLQSRSLTAMAQSPASSLPLPLPKAFVEGFDKQKADSDYSEFPAYFMGKWSADGFRQYYIAAFYLKETVPFILLLATALLFTLKRGAGEFRRSELLLYCYLPLVLFVVLSFFNKLNVGIRYLLPAYPYLCLFIARFYRTCGKWRRARQVLWLLLVLHSVSVLRGSPHFISYFNELAGGPAYGYRYLIDSNIDWGQDLPSLKRFMTEHGIYKVQLAYFGHALPELYGISCEPLSDPPKPGYVAISASLLQGHPYLLTYLSPPQIVEFDQYRFMRNLEPVGRAGYSIMVYKVD